MKKRIAIVVSIVLLLMIGAVWWLCYTQSGLRFILSQLNHLPKTSIKVESISGTLAGPLHIGSFELDDDYVHVNAKNIDLDLNPALLPSGWIAVHGVIERADVSLKHHPHSASVTPVHFLPHFLHVYASSLTINHASFTHYNGFNIQATPITTRLQLSRNHLALSRLDAQGDWFAARGEFHLDSGITLTLESQLDATLKSSRAALHGNVNMKGDISKLKFVADLQQPNLAHATATLSFPDHAWLISGHAESARWLLDPWLHNAPLSFSRGIFDYTMDEAGLHVKGNVAVPEWSRVPLQIGADLQFIKQDTRHVIAIKRADIGESVSHIQTHTTGSITLTDSTPLLDLHSSWQYLQWPIAVNTSQTYFHSTHGSASLKGAMPYQFTVDAGLSTFDVNDSTVNASGTLATDSIKLAPFDWRVWNGALHGTAQLGFEKPRHWQFDVQAQDINPAALLTTFPGQISFAARGSGNDINDVASDFDVSLHDLNGTLRKQSVHAQGRITHHAREWQADHLNVHWGDASLTASGNTGVHNDIRVHVDAPALQQLGLDIQGQLMLDGSLQGTREQPHVTVKAQSDKLAYGQWKTRGFELDTDIDLSDETASHLSLSANQLGYGDQLLSQLSVSAQGQAASHDISLQAVLDTAFTDHQQLQMELRGAYASKYDKHSEHANQVQWQGQLTRMDVKDKQLRAALDHAAELHFERNQQNNSLQLVLSDFCFHVDNGHACASGEWRNNGEWQARASIDQLPLTLEHAAGSETTTLSAVVDARVDLHRNVDQPFIGNAKLGLSNGTIRYQLADHDEVLPITIGTAQIAADMHNATATASLHIASDTAAEFNASVDRNEVEMENWPLHGRLTLRSEDAKVIPVFVHEVDRAGGALSGEINLTGTLGAPSLNGSVQLNKGELDFYRWNLSLRELQLNAQLNENQIQFNAQGNAGQGMLNASGNLEWHDQINGKLQLSGNNLLLADSPEYHVLASPNLTFDISHVNGKGNIAVSGDVVIPSAKLQPQAITNAVQISPDARFKDDSLYARDSTWRVDSNVNVKLGDDVHFDGLGLQGQLNGEVMTRLRSGVMASGRGELGIINDGHYEAYGRKLDIKRGRLLFDNTPLDNPGLDIQAERVINDVNLGDITVGVYVRGFLRDPRLQFYSDPSMTQTQIVSYLVMGKPFDQLQGTETTTVRSATSSLAMQGGGYLAGQLGRRIGLEEAGVETDANNQSALVLGKFLSPRLYVSYGISLTQAINTLKLRYSVSKHWTIKTEAGEAKSADVEFKIDR